MGDGEDTELDLLVEIASAESAALLVPLASACNRLSIGWACFFTGEGVRVLQDDSVVEAVSGARKAVVCEQSWESVMGDRACPVELGSQTDNSSMMGDAVKVLSI